MIYLDNAATTWPKPSCVREAVRQALELYGANPGRGGHAMGMAASQEIYRCRETAARFFSFGESGACGIYPELYHGTQYGAQGACCAREAISWFRAWSIMRS